MKQVFVAAWVGIAAGWMGFGWVLAEAPTENAMVVALAQDAAQAPVGTVVAGIDILAVPPLETRIGAQGKTAKEPNLRG